nr:MAG TPA: hypothetical protein [Caudoviricetes sp.]
MNISLYTLVLCQRYGAVAAGLLFVLAAGSDSGLIYFLLLLLPYLSYCLCMYAWICFDYCIY